jgi:hypothetical protein
MNQCMTAYLLLATLLNSKISASMTRDRGDFLAELQAKLDELHALKNNFVESVPTPESTCRFEQQLNLIVREIARLTTEFTYNTIEPADPKSLPPHVEYDGTSYSRINRMTPETVATLFGNIKVFRVGYRSTAKDGRPTIFPLTQSLGIIHGASPALASRIGTLHASAGSNQNQVRQRLRSDNRVSWSVTKLRKFLARLAELMAPQRHHCQVERLVQLLHEAEQATGKDTGKEAAKLVVGRDGICLGIRGKSKGKGKKNNSSGKGKGKKSQGTADRQSNQGEFEVATTATVSIYDGKGKRLGTVALAYAPEPGQTEMTKQLTRLVRAVLRAWVGVMPQLCYVSDAGKCEAGYYKNVLAVMRHPVTKKRLKWQRVVDYYHASQRIWTMAESLFGKGGHGRSWARKQLKEMLRPGGLSRVLHSAAALASRQNMTEGERKEYQKAYNYLSKRLKYMRYWEYRENGLPIGSGVTEAACKTVYTQRLKLSGMRWSDATKPSKDGVGPQTVLDLRVLLISGVWDDAFLLVLRGFEVPAVRTHHPASVEEALVSP